MTDKKTIIVAAAFLMIFAAFLRFPGIGEQSYWLDEIVSINLAARPVQEIIFAEDGFPPLYALMVNALGPQAADDFSVRKLSAVMGVLSVGMILLLCAKLVDLKTGIFASILLALSPLHVWYSREGRMYVLMVLLSIFSSLFIKEVVNKGNWRSRTAFFVISLFGIMTHYVYAGMLAAQLLYLSSRLSIRRVFLRWFGVSCIVMAILGAILFPVIKEAIIYWPLGPVREFKLFSLPYTALTFVSGFGIGPPLEELHRNPDFSVVSGYWPEVLSVIIAGLAVGAAGLWALCKEKDPDLRLYVILWLIIPPAAAILISWITGAGYNVRYSIASLPAFILLVGLGLARVGRVFSVMGLALLVIISFTSIARDRFNPRYAREDLRTASRYLETAVEKQDRIFAGTKYIHPVLYHYYKGSHRIESLPIRSIKTSENAHTILKILSNNRERTWLVLCRDWEEDPDGLLTRELAKNEKAELAVEVPGVKIYHIKK